MPAPRRPQPSSPGHRHPQRRPGGRRAALCLPLPLCPLRHSRTAAGSALRAPGSPLPGPTCGGLAPTGQELAWGASGPCRPGPGKQDPSVHEDGLPAQGRQPGGGHAGPRGCSQGHGAASEDAARARRTLVPDPDGVRGLLPLPGAPTAKGGAATDLKGPGRGNYCFPRAHGPKMTGSAGGWRVITIIRGKVASARRGRPGQTAPSPDSWGGGWPSGQPGSAHCPRS